MVTRSNNAKAAHAQRDARPALEDGLAQVRLQAVRLLRRLAKLARDEIASGLRGLTGSSVVFAASAVAGLTGVLLLLAAMALLASWGFAALGIGTLPAAAAGFALTGLLALAAAIIATAVAVARVRRLHFLPTATLELAAEGAQDIARAAAGQARHHRPPSGSGSGRADLQSQ